MPAAVSSGDVFDFFKGFGIKHLQRFFFGGGNVDAFASAVIRHAVRGFAGGDGFDGFEFAIQYQSGRVGNELPTRLSHTKLNRTHLAQIHRLFGLP